MSEFKYLGNSTMPPIGAIVSYLGKSDPDGWVICDGVNRPNYGQYNSLLNMSIGTGSAGTISNPTTYAPPNLKSRYLRGSLNITSPKEIGGISTYTLTVSNLPSHTHTITTTNANHSHTAISTGEVGALSMHSSGSTNVWSTWPGGTSFSLGTTSSKTGIADFDADYTGGNSPFNMLPSSISVNHIIKYG